MHLSFGKKLNKCNIWLVISGQSNCIDHKMACLAWESEGYLSNLVANCNAHNFVSKIVINAGMHF